MIRSGAPSPIARSASVPVASADLALRVLQGDFREGDLVRADARHGEIILEAVHDTDQ